MQRRNKFEPIDNKLNLIPVMDAVFIFIFFLLFSAQFIKMFEIETDAPLVSQIPVDKKLDKDPLNLKIKVLESSIQIFTGVDEVLLEKLERFHPRDKEKLKKIVFDLRQKHPDDDYAVIAPTSNIPYEDVVEVIDIIQTLPKDLKVMKIKTKGKTVEKKKIFTQIVLEPLDEA